MRHEANSNSGPGPTKPLLRWAGSKRSVVTKLAENSPPHFKRYIEPFVGSGALFFHLAPQEAILSDLNPEIVNLFIQIRSSPAPLCDLLHAFPRDKETYLEVRKEFGTEADPLERAASMLYLNRNCFNGLYRTNKSGKFNVPYAAAGRGAYPTLSDFEACAQRLQKAIIRHGDFFDVVSHAVQEGDFVYLDPPYLLSEGRIFSEYVKGHFCKKDTDRLAELLDIIDQKGAHFLLSFIDDQIIHAIARKWLTETYLVQKNISGFASSRRKSPELLVKNW